MLVFFPSVFHFGHYTFRDLAFFTLSGVAHYVAQTTQSLAYKYEEASKVTPIVYSIGIYLITIDIFAFKYNFNWSDLTGAGIVSVFLAIPIIVKCIRTKKK